MRLSKKIYYSESREKKALFSPTNDWKKKKKTIVIITGENSADILTLFNHCILILIKINFYAFRVHPSLAGIPLS